ncbi:MAG: hypothetical protein IPQ15_14970 [Betaproteobacteria bacterium]|jgi:hypothetical protein|nr:hypothetical protein [Betaproteobacteria bacterium]
MCRGVANARRERPACDRASPLDRRWTAAVDRAMMPMAPSAVQRSSEVLGAGRGGLPLSVLHRSCRRGFMVRIVVAFVVVAVTLPLIAWFSGGEQSVRNLAMVAGFTLPATAVGIPVFLWFRRRGWLRWWQSTAGGVGIGLLSALPFALRDPGFLAFAVPAFANIGAAHGLLFWLLAVWDPRRARRDRRYPSSA